MPGFYKTNTPWFDDKFQAGMRSIPGAQYNTPVAKGCWIYPQEQRPAVKALQEKVFGAVTASNLKETVEAAIAALKAKYGFGGDLMFGEVDAPREVKIGYSAACSFIDRGDYAAAYRAIRSL